MALGEAYPCLTGGFDRRLGADPRERRHGGAEGFELGHAAHTTLAIAATAIFQASWAPSRSTMAPVLPQMAM